MPWLPMLFTPHNRLHYNMKAHPLSTIPNTNLTYRTRLQFIELTPAVRL